MGDFHLMAEVSADTWEAFLQRQEWSPFLQSWPMGEVYRAIGQEPVRIAVEEDGEIVAVCLAIEVPARRGKHLMVQYGPVIRGEERRRGGEEERNTEVRNTKCEVRSAKCEVRKDEVLRLIVETLKEEAKKRGCAFVRMSPFWKGFKGEKGEKRVGDGCFDFLRSMGFRSAPMHLLAEHIWYLDLEKIPRRQEFQDSKKDAKIQRYKETKGIEEAEEMILMEMRQTTRNLIRRAEKEGVTVTASEDPVRDLPIFFALYEETCKRHYFVPYSEAFIRAQVVEFTRDQKAEGRRQSGCTLYIARYNGEPVSASVHMHYGKETSYHHGASTTKYPKCFASYLLQWTAIKDAIARGDRVYNFWGIAPVREESGKWKVENEKHPFAGVTTFKTGFGGDILNLVHCMDLPVSPMYWLTFGFEMLRKWKRGF